jgi:hypothetical protein
MPNYVFLPIFGLIGMLISLQAIEIQRLKERMAKHEANHNKEGKI